MSNLFVSDKHTLFINSANQSRSFIGPNVNASTEFDFLIDSQTYLFTFDTSQFNMLQSTGRGFEIEIQQASCGSTLVAAKGKPLQFGFNSTTDKPDPNNPLCIWTVADNSITKLSDLVLQINATLQPNNTGKLTVYDSISLRKDCLHSPSKYNGTENSYLGSIRSAIIIYNYTDALKSNFSVNFTVQSLGNLHDTFNI